MAQVPKRKFLALGVDEVSLVDEPANETPIAVMKRKEQEDMTTPAAATTTTTPAAEQPGAPSTPTTKAASDVEHVDVDASDASADVLKRLTTAVEALVAKSTDDEDAEKKKGDKPGFMAKAEEEKKAKMDALRKQLEKAGLDKKAIDKAVSTAFGASTKKDADGEGEVDTEKADAALDVLELLGETIAKAKKFTPKRLAELEAVTEKLTGLLADLKGVEKAQPMPGGVVATGTQADANPGQPSGENMPQSVPNPGTATMTETLKSKDGELQSAITEAVAKALKPLQDELEAIKKTRTPSTVGPTGTDAGAPKDGGEVKTEKSFWSGVL